MRRITEFLLCLYVFSIPWDFIPIPGIGSLARLQGIVVVAAVVLTVLSEGRIRKPDPVLGFATLFAVLSILSLTWTVAPGFTYTAAVAYAQLILSVWIVREIARTREQQQRVIFAFCLGIFVPIVSLMINFIRGTQLEMSGQEQFSSVGLNADSVGVLLTIGFPFAWYLMTTQGRVRRVLSMLYLGLAPIGVMLTAVRGAFLALLVALMIVPLSMKLSTRSLVRAIVLLFALGTAVLWAVPASSWRRIATIPEEIGSGSMSARRDLWTAGIRAFPERPLLGFGAGAFGSAIEPLHMTRFKNDLPAHSVPVGLLVEHGVIGFVAFVALLVACGFTIIRLPPQERMLWSVLMLVWIVGAISGSLERWKVTWVLFGLLAAQSGPRSQRHAVRQLKPTPGRPTHQVPAYATSGPVRVNQRIDHR